MTLDGKVQSTHQACWGGVSVRVSGENRTRKFTPAEPTTGAFLAFLGETTRAGTEPLAWDPATTSEFARASRAMEDRLTLLNQIYRSFGDKEANALKAQLCYDQKLKVFEVASCAADIRRGEEESASLVMDWLQPQGNSLVRCQTERCLSSADRLFEELSEEASFSETIRMAKGRLNPWPSPDGRVPLYWSARALGKLIAY